MIKWFKLFDNQYFGFWVLGPALFLLQEVPYIIMPFFEPESNPIMSMPESSAFLNVCEKILGSLCIAFMTFIICDEKPLFSVGRGMELLFFCVSIGILLLNYAGWILYFTGHQSFWIMMFFIVTLPPLYYVFVGLWRNNIILTISGFFFLIVHFVHVAGNLRMGQI